MQITDISISGIRNNHLVTGIAVNDVIQTVSGSSSSVGKYFVYLGKHKSITISFTNHQNYQNSLYQANLTLISGTNYSQTLGEHVSFTGNESATIHTGEYEYVMFQCNNQTAYVATVTDITDDMKLVNGYQLDNDLTSVANAIRAKSGGSSALAFPAGFVSEIQSIPSGGGGLNLPNNLHLIVGNFPERYLDPGTSPGSVTFELKEVWYSTPTVQPGGYHDQTFTKTFTFDDTEGWEYYAHSIEDICTIFGISISSLHIGSAGEYLEMRMTSVTGVSSWSTTRYDVHARGDFWYFRTTNYNQYQYADVSNIVSAMYTDNARVRYDFVFEASWEDD